MPHDVRITDVSPRDGLQNEPGLVATPDKARLVRLLAETGVDEIEVSSFVSPKWVPQLGDVSELLRELGSAPRAGKGRRPIYSFLVPNARGMGDAVRAGAAGSAIDKVAVFTAASEAFSLRNTNASIAESLERFRPVIEVARSWTGGPIPVRGYISCVISCPFEGPISPQRVANVAERLAALGVSEIDLGDTIGAGTPETIRGVIEAVLSRLGRGWLTPDRFTLHLHDTFGRAAACVRTALDLGVHSFDGSVAGLGGCPYASTPAGRAPGNIATETLVRTIHEAGFTTGVDPARLAHAAAFARAIVAKARGTIPPVGAGGAS